MTIRTSTTSRWRGGWWRGVAATALLVGLLGGAAPHAAVVSAATCTVISAADSGAGTLREKLADVSCTTIDFNTTTMGSGTITLTSGQMGITRDVTISGPGAASLTISGNTASRVFYQDENTTATIKDLTIANGKPVVNVGLDDFAEGGGIFTLGTLTVANAVVRDNVGFGGGGITSTNSLTITNSTIKDNQSTANGGGINSFGLVLTGSTVTGNTSVLEGGGIVDGNLLTISGSFVNDNTSGTTGGGIFASTIALTNTTLSGNTASSGAGIYLVNSGTVDGATITGNTSTGDGGGITAASAIALTNSTLSGNKADRGGGMYSSNSATLDNTAITGNTATQGGGIAISSKGTTSVRTSLIQENTAAQGGGIATLYSGTLILQQSAVVNNHAVINLPTIVGGSAAGLDGGLGGGLYTENDPDTIVVHSTISGNTAELYGGGLYNVAVQANVAVAISLSTIANNSAGSDGGGTYSDTDTGYTPTTISGSIVTGNTVGGAANNARGVLKSYGYNVVQTGTAGFTAATGDQVVADAKLGPLAVNLPGLTPTHALLAGSPAIDLGPGADCVTFLQSGPYPAADQRGVARPQGTNCDAGAYEVATAVAPTVTALNPASIPSGSATTVTITGTGFLPDGRTTVTIGGVAYPVTYISPTEITVALPAGAVTTAGNLPVVVTNSGPGGGSANTSLTVTPSVSGYTLTLTTDGAGNIGAAPAPDAAGSRYSAGVVVSLTPQAPAGLRFVGWRVDGIFQGWAATLDLTMNADHTAQAVYRAPAAFADVPANSFGDAAIIELATRGIIRGYADGSFGPTDQVLRAQLAALVGRATGADAPSGPGIGPATWATEDHGNPFSDQGAVDAELWRTVGSLAFHNVARGYGDGTYDPTGPVLHAQAISLITRAMVAKGYWVQQPDDASIYGAIPANSGHRTDVATFVHYAGALPLTTPTDRYDGATGWNGPASRAWVVEALWAALNSYHQVDRVP